MKTQIQFILLTMVCLHVCGAAWANPGAIINDLHPLFEQNRSIGNCQILSASLIHTSSNHELRVSIKDENTGNFHSLSLPGQIMAYEQANYLQSTHEGITQVYFSTLWPQHMVGDFYEIPKHLTKITITYTDDGKITSLKKMVYIEPSRNWPVRWHLAEDLSCFAE